MATKITRQKAEFRIVIYDLKTGKSKTMSLIGEENFDDLTERIEKGLEKK